MLNEVKPSTSHVYAFIGFKGTAEELGLESNNLVKPLVCVRARA